MDINDSARYSQALAFAAQKHCTQQRKDKSPYILHPIRVSMLLATKGLDVRYQIVALFHDLLEDTDTTEKELGKFCDDEMIEAVKLLTKTHNKSENDYISEILKNDMAREVKNADRIDNLTDLKKSTNIQFKKKYIKETEVFFVGRFSDEIDELLEEIKADL